MTSKPTEDTPTPQGGFEKPSGNSQSVATKSVTAVVFHELVKEYLEYCNVVFDYNYSPPMKLDLHPGQLYEVSGRVTSVKRREEPTFLGFANWLVYTKVNDLAKNSPETTSADTQIRPGEHKKQELERGK